ncbi:deoxyguanosinetriphosphate triphosphohydrolase family protein [Desulfuromonas thiophila]|uniref:deoxyguanosinetriphosphate triphosphohydrolase family protein n=1 Tax=Desulfuromonas thiophila TaxID=57664 RepID=UPI0024A99339|nr:dNTP triphosphohydrolase [Desulfuromonas thiophila]
MQFNSETIEYAKSLSTELERQNFRFYEATEHEGERARNNYQRDYARVLYSSSFRRLQGKMQLIGIDPSHFHRNRLTHSLEVAQIARTIAAELQVPNHIVVETCALAHDLGNPPFGHQGEVYLNEIAKDIGGFEGNAQTFRILHHLEKKSYGYRGLNLTFRTLLGITKYFNTKENNPKKFIYDDDYHILDRQFESLGLQHRRSIDVQIMDISDEIAYAAHDLEDSLSFGLVTIDELLYEFKISKEYYSAFEPLVSIVKECQQFGFNSKDLGSSEEYSFLFRKELTSTIVNKLINDIGVVETGNNGEKCLSFVSLGTLSEGLKKLLFKAILRKKDIQLYEKLGEKIIKGLYQVYSDDSFNKKGMLLPAEYRCNGNESDKKRHIIDYISGMMDSYAIQEYKKYFGENSISSLYSNS